MINQEERLRLLSRDLYFMLENYKDLINFNSDVKEVLYNAKRIVDSIIDTSKYV